MPAEYSAAMLQEHFAAISRKFEHLEKQIALLSEKLGVPYEAAAGDVPVEVVELVHAGKDMEAIKKYRELTGANGEEARAAIARV
jgi:hypothetical protein